MSLESLLKTEEKVIFKLRGLYRDYGYLPYKMSKFEEYDFYARNKDFLVSDGIISFTDTNGKLMALKPDVTLSIIKNFKKAPGYIQRVYYNENVYRTSGTTGTFKEIMQTGLECMGEIDFFNMVEVLIVALKSLKTISNNYVLEISHLGLLAGLLEETDLGDAFKKQVTVCISEKNPHELERACQEYNCPPELREKLTKFISIYGERNSVIADLSALCVNDTMKAALEELKEISAFLETTEFSDKVRFDFSLVNDMNYYDGIVFQGFVEGVPEVILSGGRYDKLMERVGIESGAIGFALYLDLLEGLSDHSNKYDVDIVLLYDDDADLQALREMLRALNNKGKTVSVQKAVPENIRYKELLKFNNKGVERIENND